MLLFERYQDGFRICAYTVDDQDADISWLEAEADEGVEYLPPGANGSLTAQERLDAYNRGEWCFVGVVVEVYAEDDEAGVNCLGRDSLWGVESDSHEYHMQLANEEVLPEALQEAKDAVAPLWAEG